MRDATGWKRLFVAALVVFSALTAADVYGTPSEPIPRAAYAYRATLIREARFIWGLNSPSATFGAQIESESGWRPGARNPSGAAGLGQAMPATARHINRKYPELRKEGGALSPLWAIRALLFYNRDNYRMTRPGTACQKMRHTLIAYNFGPARMYRTNLPKETRNYLTRIFAREPVYMANGFGLGSCN
jgi:soluble lytic murein transglycosylase-like protein